MSTYSDLSMFIENLRVILKLGKYNSPNYYKWDEDTELMDHEDGVAESNLRLLDNVRY